jgi:N-acetylmuramoyl-L-alanine amidase
MRTVFISAGHSTQIGADRGAFGNGHHEGDIAAEFRQLLVNELKVMGVPTFVDGNQTILSDTLAWLKRLVDNKSIAIDIHCNAATPQATGTEVIVPDDASAFENKVAKRLSATISLTLGIRDRGVKKESLTARKRLGFMRVPCENILLELFFISNASDVAKYQSKKKELAKALAMDIKDAALS